MLCLIYIVLYKPNISSGRMKPMLKNRYDFTLSELGKQVDIIRQTFAFIERGKISPSITLSLKLAKALQTSVDE